MRDRRFVESDDDARDETGGISRRTLIRRAAAAGAVAWTAPVIIESLASPAGAITGTFPCSYASVVVQLATGAIVAVKIEGSSCTLTNATSSDSTFTFACPGGATYSNNCSGNAICRNGTAVPAAGSCPVDFNNGTVTANPGNTILFAIVHDGQCTSPPGPADKFCPPFCNVTQFTANC